MKINDVSMVLELDRFPPSVNHAYYFIRKGKATIKVKTKECKEFVDYVHNLFPETYTEPKDSGKGSETKDVKPFECPVGLQMIVTMGDKRKRDLDNMLKILIDSLNGKAFLDDSQIAYIEMRKDMGKAHKINMKIFDLHGRENPKIKCPSCGKTFTRDQLIAKMDRKTGVLLGYFCEWCW